MHDRPTPIHRGVDGPYVGTGPGSKVGRAWHISNSLLQIFLHESYMANLTWILH